MSVGKNAIKRVENNGYSKVKTSAPDMENSSVIANISEEVVEKTVKPVEKKTAARKSPAKKTAQTDSVPETAPVKTRKKPGLKKASAKEGVERVCVGQDMPYYLL